MPNTQSSNSLIGVKIGPSSLKQLVETTNSRITGGTGNPFVFVCANPHSLNVAQNDNEFLTALNNADASVADGVGVTLVSKILNIDTGPRITGHDYFDAVMDLLNSTKGSVFFFGSSDQVLSRIESKIKSSYPDVQLVGTLSPPFGEWSDKENTEMLDIINSAKPDVLWVGMTAPKQEKWIEANRNTLNASMVGAIGAVFDFFAETYPRAPIWATTYGLEWLVRLVKEPKRMWKRNFVSAPLFLFRCFVQHVVLRK